MRLLIPLMIMLASPSFAAWERYSVTADGSVSHYFESKRIISDRAVTLIPVKIEYSEPVIALDGELVVASGLMNYELDCRQSKFRLTSLDGYSLPNLQGIKTIGMEDASESQKEQFAYWKSYEDESHLSLLHRRLCR